MNHVLTADEWAAVDSVAEGADVYSYILAMHLRSVEKKAPEYIIICDPKMYGGDGTDQVPYFGCIATKEGKRMLKETSPCGHEAWDFDLNGRRCPACGTVMEDWGD